MVKIVWTNDRENLPKKGSHAYWVYNGLDCCVTMEVFDQISSQLDSNTSHVYEFEKKLQAPVLEMNGKGILIDKVKRNVRVGELRMKARKLEAILDKFAHAVWDRPLLYSSPHQLHAFFYGTMRIPEIKVMSQGVWRVSTNREALEKMSVYLHARPIVSVILALRDIAKQIQTLTTGIDADNRLRTSYNIAGTETGRWSSSENAFGTGGNLQNITDMLRDVCVADEGKKLAYFDLQQAESRAVGLLAFLTIGKDNYLSACESGDLHTTVARMCWPKLPWTFSDLAADKALAEEIFYRSYSRRDLAKRGGHGSNYYGQPNTIAKNLQIEVDVATTFQTNYFGGFPDIKEWHEWTKRELRSTGRLITPFKRVRHFFDRLDDDSTLRKAIAYVPQSMIADMLNESLFRIWLELPEVEVILQVHDAVVVQYDEKREEEIIPKIIKIMRKNYIFNGRDFSIGSDAMVGWNWAKEVTPEYAAKAAKKGRILRVNPDGLRAFGGHDPRRRTERPNAFDAGAFQRVMDILEQQRF